MHCPFCEHSDTRVIDSRLLGDGDQIRRRRECQSCKARFTTYETAFLAGLMCDVLDAIDDESVNSRVRSQVTELCGRHPVYSG